MKSVGLSAKIICGFGVVLVMMLAVAGIYQYSNNSMTRAFKELADVNFELALLAGEVQENMLQARRAEKDFVIRRDMQYVDKNSKALQELIENAKKIVVIETGAGDLERVAMAQKVIGYAKSYQEEFGGYVAASQKVGLDHKSGLQGKFREAAQGIQSEIDAAGDVDLMAIMLTIRKHEKDFMLRMDKKYVAALHDSVGKLRSGLNSDAAREKLAVYEKGFDTMVAAYDEMAQNNEKMRQVIHKIEPLAEEILADLVAASHDMAKRGAAHTAKLSQIALAVAAVALLIGLTLAFALARTISKPIKESVRGLTGGAEQVSAAAGQVASSSQVLAGGASEQAASLEETSASLEEMASMTKHNADNSSEADSLMRNAIDIIKKADLAMDEMSISMTDISQASEETSKIVKTIDEIAFQTNLLALNAAVEAARAGEAGAGFAVVADEVRNLAMRAAEAAKNTSSLIDGTVQKVSAGKKIVDKTNEAFKEVASYSGKVGALVGEIAVASKEQATGVNQINQAITQLDTVTQQNSATSEESAAASEELNAQAEVMMDIVKGLQAIVDGAGGSRKKTKTSKGGVPEKTSNAVKTEPKRQLAALPAAPAKPRMAAAAKKKSEDVNPEDIIPMDDDDDFEDF